MTVQAALTVGAKMLRDAGNEDPGRDARRIMSVRLGVEPGRLSLHLHDPLGRAEEAAFYADIVARAEGRPVSHLLGWREFYGRRFSVDARVLDPRPDTETLIEAALAVPFREVLDLGTGSGCILLTLLAERAGTRGTGTDISVAALDVAGQNAARLGVADRCALIESDWYGAVDGAYDLIVSNPPYIAAAEMSGLGRELSYEPRMALTDEGDGLSAYRIIVPGAGAHLRPGGWLMVEIGWTQGAAVKEMFAGAGYHEVALRSDLDGRDRVVMGQWSG